MPPQEVGEAFVAIRAIATGFREQASAEVNSALAQVRERATVPIRAQVETTSAARVQQSFQPVIGSAQRMGTEVSGAYQKTEASSHHAYETIRATHGGISARFGETLRAASAMGGGIALAYGAFSQARSAITATNELAHDTGILTQATGLSARQASAWIGIAQTQGISATQLRTSFGSLSRATDGANQAFQKAAASATQNLGQIHAEQIRVNADAIAYHDALDKYGQGSAQAASALATLSSAQNTLSGYLDKSSGSATGAAAAFTRLGITQGQLQSVQGNLPAELGLIADKFQSMGAGTDRATLAQQLFGRGASVLLPILDQGRAGIQRNIDVATQYGATLSGSTLAGMEQLRTEQQRLSLEMLGLRVRIATVLEPVLITLGGYALDAMNKFIRLGSEGVNFAKRTMDNFLRTPYGQEFQTIGQEAARFAGNVRDRFERDLSRPLSFGGLFTTFGRDLTTALPRMAREFWTQLNSDLFAPGHEINVRLPMHVTPVQAHEAGIPTQQLAGAGMFPGSNFAEQGRHLGAAIFSGLLDGFMAAVHAGNRILTIMQDLFGSIVTWIVSGGGAAMILSGALDIANAFVTVIFDPSFWIANWRPILGLAFVFFSDGFGRLGLSIVGKFGEIFGPRLAGVAARVLPEFIRTAEREFRALPERLGVQILRLGEWIGSHFGPEGRQIVDAITAWAADVPRTIISKFAELPTAIARLFGRIREFVGNALDVGFIGNLILRAIEGIAKISVVGILRDLGKRVVEGFWHGLQDAAGALLGGLSFIGEWIRGIERDLGIASPSRVAMGWGRAVVQGFVNGLENLPIIGRLFRVEFTVLSVVVRTYINRIRDIIDGLIGYVRAWANLIGDVIHGRWGHIMGDLEGIVRAGIRLVNAVLGGLPGDIIRLAPLALNAAERVGSRIVSGVINEARRLPDQVAHVVREAGNRLLDLGTWVFNQAKHLGSRIVNGAISGVSHLGSELKNKAESLIGDALGSLNPFSPVEHGGDVYIARPIIRGATDGLAPFLNALHDALIPPLRSVMNDMDDQGIALGRNFGQDMRQAVMRSLNPLQDQMRSLWRGILADVNRNWNGISSALVGWVRRAMGPVNQVLTGIGGNAISVNTPRAAKGGIFKDVPGGLLHVVEGGHPESIVPHDPAYRGRAIDIIHETLRAFGYPGIVKMQAGGITDAGLQPADARLADMIRGWGGIITSTVRNEPGSYHSTGQAIDTGYPQGGALNVWANLFGHRNIFAELFGPTALRGGGLYHFGSPFSDPPLQAQHQNHIHVAFTGTIAQLLAGMRGAAITGLPSSPGGGGFVMPFGGDPVGYLRSHLPNLPGNGPANNFAHSVARFTEQRILAHVGDVFKRFSATAGAGAGPAGTAASGSAQQIGRAMMLAAGWPASQWGALQALWMRESGWNPNAVNPSSGAYGIPQSLGHGHPYNLGDVRAQVAWGLNYIRGRYGSPAAAWAHEQQVGWYHNGGVVPGRSTDNVPIMAQGGEVVLKQDQFRALAGQRVNIEQLNIIEHGDGRDAARRFLDEIAMRSGA